MVGHKLKNLSRTLLLAALRAELFEAAANTLRQSGRLPATLRQKKSQNATGP